MPSATLFNPAKPSERKAVVIGSPDEKALFAKGYKLEEKPSGSLKGTLASPDPLSTEDSYGSLSNFTKVMRSISDYTMKQQPSAMDVLDQFNQRGLQVISGVQAAAAQGEDYTARDVARTFTGAVDTIQEKMKNDKSFTDKMWEYFAKAKNGKDLLTPDVLQDIKNGVPTIGLADAIQKLDFGEDRSQVIDISQRYPDAGVSPDDTIEAANKKVVENSRIYKQQTRLAGSGGGSGGGTATKVDPLVKAVMDNPEIYNQLTATQKGKVAPALNELGFTAFGKELSDTAIKEISQSQTALDELNALKDSIQGNEQYLGPIAGLQKYNPYSPAKKLQAKVDLIRQRVGKALEGGVLRKEDESKYKQILATLSDTPELALEKINSLITSISNDMENYKSGQQSAGRNVYKPVNVKTKAGKLDLSKFEQ